MGRYVQTPGGGFSWNRAPASGRSNAGIGAAGVRGAGRRQKNVPAPPPRVGYSAPTAPDWWKGVLPANTNDPNEMYKTLVNALIPTASPEDQMYYAQYLYRVDPTNYATYKDVSVPTPSTVTSADTATYLGQDRAENILRTLSNLQAAIGKTEADMGEGYLWLKNIAGTMKQFGNLGLPGQTQVGMTRADYEKLIGALEPVTNEAKQGDLAKFSSLGRVIYNPYFSMGQIAPGYYNTTTGKYTYGKAQGGWY